VIREAGKENRGRGDGIISQQKEGKIHSEKGRKRIFSLSPDLSLSADGKRK
jgi:hypothetical protein